MTATQASSAGRQQNRWGEGGRLRAEILQSARRLLEQEGTEAAVSMRGVARAVGVTPPSVYAHFPNQQELIAAVIVAIYADFVDARRAAVAKLAADASPRARLRAGVQAFVAFCQDHPASSQMLWVRPHPSVIPAVGQAAAANHRETLDVLDQACPGLTEAELQRRGQVLWATAYGLGALPPHHPRFAWCSPDELIDDALDGILRPAA